MAFCANVPGGALLQYGALGLCAILIGLLAVVIKMFSDYMKRLSDIIEAKDAGMAKQTREFTAAITEQGDQFRGAVTELTTVLRNRPCLLDSTLRETGG